MPGQIVEARIIKPDGNDKVFELKVIREHQDEASALQSLAERVGGYRALRNISAGICGGDLAIGVVTGILGNASSPKTGLLLGLISYGITYIGSMIACGYYEGKMNKASEAIRIITS